MFVARLLKAFKCKQCGQEFVACLRSFKTGGRRCYTCRGKTAEEAVAEVQKEIEEEMEWIEQEIADYDAENNE